VSRLIAKKPPTARTGFATTALVAVLMVIKQHQPYAVLLTPLAYSSINLGQLHSD
jgi:hypothetical protein